MRLDKLSGEACLRAAAAMRSPSKLAASRAEDRRPQILTVRKGADYRKIPTNSL